MTEQIQHVKSFHYTGLRVNGADTTSHEETFVSQRHASALAKMIWCTAGVIVTLLALRFVFMLFGANQNHLFVSIIYTLSTPFTAPFFSVFSYIPEYDVPGFEYSTLVAIATYGLVAYGLARLTTIRRS